jgi:hypothetical protein
MEELVELFGPVGLGLITLAIPYFLQVIKEITKWEGKIMYGISIGITYLFVDLYLLGTLLSTPEIVATWGAGVLYFLGGLIYPLLVWIGTQGLYSKFISKERFANEK